MGDNPTVDRQAVVNGFMDENGNPIGGEFSILEGVYNDILQTKTNWHRISSEPEKYFNAYATQGRLNFSGAPTTVEEFKKMCEHRVAEYHKILECWDELVPFVLKDLVKKEGVKLGIKREFMAAASSDNFGENDIASKWDMSESKRDGWMENSDMQSAFGSVGQQVRRILATVPQMEARWEQAMDANGKPILNANGTPRKEMVYVPVVDDLGNQVHMDAQKTHQALQDYLRGIQDSEQMLEKLCKEGRPGEAKIPWMQPIVDILGKQSSGKDTVLCGLQEELPALFCHVGRQEGKQWIHQVYKDKNSKQACEYAQRQI